MEAVLVTVLGLVLTGLTVWAYHHPVTYKPTGLAVSVILAALFVAIIGWNTALDPTGPHLRLLNEMCDGEKARKLLAGFRVGVLWQVVLGAAVAYSVFLLGLRRIVGRAETG